VVRLPDPEWDRIQALENRIQELEKRLRTLEARQGRPAGSEEPAYRTGRAASAKTSRDKNQ
jgi:hypothetical protein